MLDVATNPQVGTTAGCMSCPHSAPLPGICDDFYRKAASAVASASCHNPTRGMVAHLPQRGQGEPGKTALQPADLCSQQNTYETGMLLEVINVIVKTQNPIEE